MSSSMTLCGNDATLLKTRRMLLERAGFSIRTVLGVAAMESSGHRPLILCHSLSEAEQLAAIETARAAWPQTKILVLGGECRERASRGCESLPTFAEPGMLIERARQMAR